MGKTLLNQTAMGPTGPTGPEGPDGPTGEGFSTYGTTGATATFTWTGSGSGGSVGVSRWVKYTKVDDVVWATIPKGLTGANGSGGSSTYASQSGAVPSGFRPVNGNVNSNHLPNSVNGSWQAGSIVRVSTTGVLTLLQDPSGNGFPASNTVNLIVCTFHYPCGSDV